MDGLVWINARGPRAVMGWMLQSMGGPGLKNLRPCHLYSLHQHNWQNVYFLINKFFQKTAQKTAYSFIKLAQKLQPAAAKKSCNATKKQPNCVGNSDNVTRVNDSTRVTIFGDSDSSRVTLKRMVIWLDSSHVFHRMTRVRVIFTISLSSWWTNPARLHTKKWGFFASVMIKIGGNFLSWLSSCAMLQSSVPNLRRGRPETLLSLRSQ